jgi:hypothetical protein
MMGAVARPLIPLTACSAAMAPAREVQFNNLLTTEDTEDTEENGSFFSVPLCALCGQSRKELSLRSAINPFDSVAAAGE